MFDAADQGDETAIRVLDTYLCYVAIGIANATAFAEQSTWIKWCKALIEQEFTVRHELPLRCYLNRSATALCL